MSNETQEFDLNKTISEVKETVETYMLASMWSYDLSSRRHSGRRSIEELKSALVALQAHTDQVVLDDYEDKRIWSIVHMVEYYTGELEVITAQLAALEELEPSVKHYPDVVGTVAMLTTRKKIWTKQLELHTIAIAAHMGKVQEREFAKARRELDEDIIDAEEALKAKLEESMTPEVKTVLVPSNSGGTPSP